MVEEEGDVSSLSTLPNKHLLNIQKYLASFNDHPLNGEILSDALCLRDLIMHNLNIKISN